MKTEQIILKDISPNPFKKFINGGKMNEDTIAKLIEGFKQTKFHANLCARRNEKEIELIYGHHRLEAAKKVYGKDNTVKTCEEGIKQKQITKILSRDKNREE